jgi:crotonobetaine/carnitine-CoA ligase
MITDLLAERARRSPDAVFVCTDEADYSFGEIFGAARQFAHRLQDAGIGKGDHVALLADNGVPFVIAMLGISWLGAVPVALNNELVADGLCYTLEQSDAKLIVADARWVHEKRRHLGASLRALPQIALESETALLEVLAALPQAEGGRVAGDATCTILYTSGTTGLPKGVMNSHDCYEAVGRDTVRALKLTGDDRIMVFLPLFHTNPQMYALMPALTVGCSLILRPRFSASRFFDDARRFGATGVTFVGTVLSILVTGQAGEDKNHGLRFAIGGGAPPEVWRAVHDRFGFRIHELYGMTEVGGWVSCNTADEYRLGSCGRLRKSMDVRIFDEADREVPAGVQGEIVVRPKEPNVILSGYYRKPEALVQSSRNFWFHTGDRGSIDADGYLYFHGRTKELIRRAGEMISPVEIETKLRTMAGVADCAAVGVDDPIMGEEIKMAVVMEAPVSPHAIVAYLAPLVPRYMLPRYVEFVAAIPKTETEKIQRNKLQYLNASVHDLTALK